MIVRITLNPGIGADLGPDFLVTCDVQGWSQIININDLYVGIDVFIPDGSTLIYIQSLGECPNTLTLLIEDCNPTTTTTSSSTTTSTTTIAPTTTTTTTLPPTTTTTTTLLICNLELEIL